MQTFPTPQRRWQFNDNDPRYRLCCCHVRKWAIAVGVIEIVFLLLNIVSLVLLRVYAEDTSQGEEASSSTSSSTTSTSSNVSFIVGIVLSVLWAVVILLLFCGLKKENPFLLIPNLIVLAITIGCCVVAAFLFALAGATNFVTIIILVIAGVIYIFFFYVLIRCVNFFSQKRSALKPSGVPLPMFVNQAANELPNPVATASVPTHAQSGPGQSADGKPFPPPYSTLEHPTTTPTPSAFPTTQYAEQTFLSTSPPPYSPKVESAVEEGEKK